ncbi:hypothetical protein [Rhodococcus sp. O3]|uniref:hypothetical protein n=1 Tax=Rhodococcus sp. O3 TaxID=3404919 RepID=UPI003B685C00
MRKTLCVLTIATGIAAGSAGTAAAHPVALSPPVAPVNITTPWCTHHTPQLHLSALTCLASIVSTGSA